MKGSDFNKWFACVQALSPAKKELLTAALTGTDPAATVASELGVLGLTHCPHCAAGSPVRFGYASGPKSYKGHAYRRTFNALTHTPLARLHHCDAWRVFAQALIDGESVRRSVAKAGVHRNTAFRWRHRFLAEPAAMQAKRLAGIAEADDTFMRRSSNGARDVSTKKTRKGRNPDDKVGVLIMRDRKGHTLSSTLQTVDHQTMNDAVGHRLQHETTLCNGGAPVYRRHALHCGVTHEPANQAQGIRVREAPRFMCKTSMSITADGKAGWNASTA